MWHNFLEYIYFLVNLMAALYTAIVKDLNIKNCEVRDCPLIILGVWDGKGVTQVCLTHKRGVQLSKQIILLFTDGLHCNNLIYLMCADDVN